MIEETLINLTAEELKAAKQWLERINQSDVGRMVAVLDYLNHKKFTIESEAPLSPLPHKLLCPGMETEMAVIVAGSSVDTQAYKDIDLFVIPRHHLYRSWIEGYNRASPKSVFLNILHDDVALLPIRVFPSEYGLGESCYSMFPFSEEPEYRRRFEEHFIDGFGNLVDCFDNDGSLNELNELTQTLEAHGLPLFFIRYFQGFHTTGISTDNSVVDRYIFGAPISISLFHELEGFDIRRPGCPGDLLVPIDDDLLPGEVCMDGEELIEYNRKESSRFLVLSRQYSP
jgi:hypothetical protein